MKSEDVAGEDSGVLVGGSRAFLEKKGRGDEVLQKASCARDAVQLVESLSSTQGALDLIFNAT